MRLPLSLIAAAVLASASGAAHAADPGLIGATSGFLLGNAYRCSVPADRVVRAGKVIRNMIHAAAQNAGEEEAANAGFAAAFFSSAYLDADGEVLVPPCEAVIKQFDRLERHHQEAGFTN